VIRGAIRALDVRAPAAGRFVRSALRYCFPDHWSFMLGEIALYAFAVLVATGIYLTFEYEPSAATVVYHGGYAPLAGAHVSRAYASSVGLSLDTKGGLLVRQTHHWAALVFVVAIVLHLFRVFFTGAYRKPRDLNWAIGVTMLALGVFEGFAGYSLPDDLLSGMGLAIAYAVALSVPLVGGQLALTVFGGPFPGSAELLPRLYSLHVLVIPVALGTLIALHLTFITLQKHTQFPGRGRTERNVVGTPLWPGYALRSLSLFAGTAAVLVALGGLVQINPIWLWGPYEPWLGTNGAQPDWYLGWLIGALRLMPNWELVIAGHTVVPNPFFGGALFPLVLFAILYGWPTIERRLSGDDARHHLLDRPRDAPARAAFGAALFTWVTTIFLAGSADRIFVTFGIDYGAQVWFFRVAAFAAPVLAYVLTRRICGGLARGDLHPLLEPPLVVRRRADGGFEEVGAPEP
jgi:ubiquinol-cytochrome c reductase cytochrome b subunit